MLQWLNTEALANLSVSVLQVFANSDLTVIMTTLWLMIVTQEAIGLMRVRFGFPPRGSHSHLWPMAIYFLESCPYQCAFHISMTT